MQALATHVEPKFILISACQQQSTNNSSSTPARSSLGSLLILVCVKVAAPRRILAPSFPVRRLQLALISSFHLPPASFSLPTRCEGGKLRAAACKRLPRGEEEGSPPRRRVRKSGFIPPLWSDPRASSSAV